MFDMVGHYFDRWGFCEYLYEGKNYSLQASKLFSENNKEKV